MYNVHASGHGYELTAHAYAKYYYCNPYDRDRSTTSTVRPIELCIRIPRLPLFHVFEGPVFLRWDLVIDKRSDHLGRSHDQRAIVYLCSPPFCPAGNVILMIFMLTLACMEPRTRPRACMNCGRPGWPWTWSSTDEGHEEKGRRHCHDCRRLQGWYFAVDHTEGKLRAELEELSKSPDLRLVLLAWQ